MFLWGHILYTPLLTGDDDADDEQLLRAASMDLVAALTASESEGDEDEAEATAGSPTAEMAGKPGVPEIRQEGAKQAYRWAILDNRLFRPKRTCTNELKIESGVRNNFI